MTAYAAVFSARFRLLLQYRAAAFAGVVTQLFWGLIRTMIFVGFYASTTAVQPMSLDQVITYIWLGQGMLLLALFRSDADVGAMIRSGTVAYELIRPLDLYRLWYCRALAERTAPVLLRLGPVFLVAILFFGLSAPANALSAALALISTLSAILLSSALGVIFTVTLLWTVSGAGINRLTFVLIYVFSGLVVPLPLFPDWLQPALYILPFRGLMDTPFRIYMGHIPPADALIAILHQLTWTAAFILVGRRLLSRGLRKLVAQGG